MPVTGSGNRLLWGRIHAFRVLSCLLMNLLLCVVAARANPTWLEPDTARRSQREPSTVAAAGHCAECEKKTASRKSRAKSGKPVSCHPKGYVDPKLAKNYHNALRELRRDGVQPTVTSAWRSSAQQAKLHNCSLNGRCRRKNPGLYYALPPGHSMHEAGFAVDISGVASGKRGNKQLTPRGRKIVAVMRKNGFKWRYGLKDPAHFEADPRRYGYRSAEQAINHNQTTCDLKLAKRPARRYPTTTALHRTTIAKR